MGPNRPEDRSKRQWRRAMVAAILGLDAELRRAEERALIAAFRLLPGYAAAETVLLFVSAFPEEMATVELFAQSYDARKRVLCPRVDRAGRRLRLYRVNDPSTELSPGVLGIPEPRVDLPEVSPRSVDWALVPGLAFDEQGFRLGRGAGHYDRLLPQMRADASRWALCLSCQLVPRLPVEPHDQPLDGVSTPDRFLPGTRRPAGPVTDLTAAGPLASA